MIEQIIQSLKKNNKVNNLNSDEVEKVNFLQSNKQIDEIDENLISSSDGFSKIIFEDLKVNRALSEEKVAQEHLLNINDIRECFSYLADNFNNVRLHQGRTWVIEYIGGL
ncbi:MAG: hypothetical protein ACFFDH_02395 [Promethearchaeota archaeon]